MRHFILPITALALLAACDTPTPLTVDNADFNRAVVNNKAAAGFEVTPVNDIPNGFATYDGAFTSSARIDGESGYSLIGDVQMRADFGTNRTSAVSGSITDINLIDRNFDRDRSQRLDGSLIIDGITGLGEVAADATGPLTWVASSGLGLQETSDVALRLDGDVRSSGLDVPGDIVHGTVRGGGRGGFDLDLTGDGRFTVGR